VNTLTDSIFVATRNAKYTTIVDGIIGGLGKNIVGVVLTGAGAYGLFVASASGFVLGSIASLVLIYSAMRIRLDLRQPLKTLKPLFGFAGANYVGNIFNMIPGLAVPLILLDRLGSDSAAYFFVVFQIVQIVYAAALALEQTFLSEGSRADADMRGLKRRSVRMLVMFCVPAALGIIAVGHWLLLAFGRPYADNGFASLVILALAAGPIAANYWYVTVLRLAGKLRAIVVVNAIYAATTCIATWIGAAHGLTGVAAGWFIGAAITTCAAVAAARQGHASRQGLRADVGEGLEPRDVNDRPASHVNRARPRPLPPPVNPFEPGFGRGDPRPVNGVRPGAVDSTTGPRMSNTGPRVNGERFHELPPPVNPFEPGFGRDPRPANGVRPGTVNGSTGPRVNGERPHGLPPPVNQFESDYGRGDPRPVNGMRPGAVNGNTGPRVNGERPRRQLPPSVHPFEPGYERADPRPMNGGRRPVNGTPPGDVSGGHWPRVNGERPGMVNGYGPRANGEYPQAVNGEYGPRAPGERPRQEQLPFDPNDPDHDPDISPGRTSLWD
jgi:hypothetical protein